MKPISLLAFLALLCVTTLPALARVATGTLEGTVTDARGRALSGATVTIQTSDGNHPHITRTDAKGHFAFVRFEIGQYDLRAYFNGAYSDWAKRLLIRTKKPTSVTLRINS